MYNKSIYTSWQHYYRLSKMSGITTIVTISKFASQVPQAVGCGFQQVRHKWANWMMIRDVKRRRMNQEAFLERLRINAMRKNDILPVEIQELADEAIAAFPLNATPLRINNRCAITSRPRGLVMPWRMSRIVWRHHVDYNKMAGIQRAMWG